ncbi:hypothetical protein SESBI_26395 [Sesbania bispinosa]|nr:hypothetical protein SESBI_26395 [Sesbania bispinosa]
MDKNNSSSSSVCNKIRQALASNPAVLAIQRISSFSQEPKPVTTNSSNSPSPPTKTSGIKTKPHHNNKPHTAGTIPIKFDHSTMGNGNSTLPSVPKGPSPHLGNSEKTTKVAAKGEHQPQNLAMQGKPPMKTGAQHGLGVHSNQQDKKSMDINDTFKEFIQRAKVKIRTVSNIGRDQSNSVAAPSQEIHGNENHKDHFSEFIHRAKKKIRTTTTVGKTGSLRRE